MGKVNCWEFMQCGRQAGGPHAGELGPCPASLEEFPDGLNGGARAGRICWMIPGTLCDGEVQGAADRKHVACCFCDFYRHVKEEEGGDFFARIPGRGRAAR
jgi:hypothetical protein